MTPLDSVELREVSLPLVSPFETSFGVETVKAALLVILRKGSITAYGECIAGTGPWYNEETITSAKHIIKHCILPELFTTRLETPSDFLNSTSRIRGNNMAVAAVEMGLWDLMGKLQSRPISKLLGGQKDAVSVGVSIGIQPSLTKLVDVVREYLSEGYQRIKIKIRPGYDLEPVKAIRKEFPEAPLQVDANSAYSLREAEPIRQLDQFNLRLIEQPLAYDDIIDHAKLQKEISTPICLDESIHTPADARKAFDVGACKAINIKAGRVRGLKQSREIHDFCKSRGIPVWCGGMLETGIGRAFNVALASLPGFTLPGDTSASRRYFKQDIIAKEFELTENGTLQVPDGPGIGVEVDQTILDSCTTRKELFTRDQIKRPYDCSF